MKIKTLALLAATALSSALSPLAFAQSAVPIDAASFNLRIQRMEERLSAMESNGGSNTTNGVSTMSSTGGGGTPTGSALADIEQRMSQLEHQGDQMNGGVERLSHAVEQMAKQLDLLAKDTDQRLTALEQKSSATPAAKPAATAAAPDAAPTPAAASTTSGTAPATPAATTTDVPANLSATEHYNKAYAYLTAADYANALKWLDAFVKRFPTDKLADNAWYWLGEVHLVQNDPQQAVVAFKNGLEKFPKGAKAPADLYKMGLALQQLNQVPFAKASWEKLLHDFPNAPETAKAKAKLEELAKAEKAKPAATTSPTTKPAPAKPAPKK